MNRHPRNLFLHVAAAIAVCGLLAGEFERSTAAAQRKPVAKKNTNKKPGGGGKNNNKGGSNNNKGGGGAAAAQKKALISKINAHIKSATGQAKAADAAAKRAAGLVQTAKNAHDKAERELKAARTRVDSVEEYLVSTAAADTPLGKARLAYHDAKDNYDKVKAEVLAGLDSSDAAARVKAVAEDPKIQAARSRVAGLAAPMRRERDKVLESSDKWTTAKYQVKMLSGAETTAEREWKAKISIYNRAKLAATAARKEVADGQRALAQAKSIKTPGGKGQGKGDNKKGGNKNTGGKKKSVARRK